MTNGTRPAQFFLANPPALVQNSLTHEFVFPGPGRKTIGRARSLGFFQIVSIAVVSIA